MNKDFHYEGTYAAAVLADFSPEDAAIIAWAAQTVDECTKENINKYYPLYNKWTPVYTCQSFLESVEDEASSILSNEDSSTLQKIRSIWMPFHFLPGNLDNHITYKDDTILKDDRDIRDFLCMCETASPLVDDMINKSIVIFRNIDMTEQKMYLIKLGILMHVLADTWAHQHFTGTPSYMINDVKNITVTTPIPIPEDFSTKTTPVGVTNYSVCYLGHGRAGHYPDYGCMTFQYEPKWLSTASQNTITRLNVDDFNNAFLEMYYALYCHQHGGSYSIETALSLSKDWNISIREILSTNKADQSEEWREKLTDFVDYNKLPEYDFSNHKQWMNLFQSYAREHREYVMGYVQRNGNILNI